MVASKRTPAVEDEVLDRLSKGEPLAVILRSDEKFPHPVVWRRWLHADADLAKRYDHARDVGHDAIADECLEIADDATNDWMEKLDRDNVPIGYTLNGEHVQRSKLRIETRLKLLAKWNPRKWGEKVDVTSDGEKIGTVADAIAAGNKRLAELEKGE